MSPMKLSPPSVPLQQRERQLAEQYLSRRKRVACRAPWFGVTRDLPNDSSDQLDLVLDSVGLVARAHPGTGGEVLTNDGGWAMIDEDRQPLGPAPPAPITYAQTLVNYSFDHSGGFGPFFAWTDELDPVTSAGPWRIYGAPTYTPYPLHNDPTYPGNFFGAYSWDSESIYVGPAIAFDEEYAFVSDATPITGASTSSIDGGSVDLKITAAIASRWLIDEARLGVYFLDGSLVQISAAVGTLITAGDGLTNTWVDFNNTFAIPTLARYFRVRCIAKKKSVNPCAGVMYDNIRVDVIV